MFEPKPSKDSIARYGEEAATVFAATAAAQADLMDAFDLLLKQTENVDDAGHQANSYQYLWNLLSEKHQKALVDFEASRTSTDES